MSGHEDGRSEGDVDVYVCYCRQQKWEVHVGRQQVILLLITTGNNLYTAPTTARIIGCKKKKRRAYASHLDRRSPASACQSPSAGPPLTQQRTAVINRALCCLHFFCHLLQPLRLCLSRLALHNYLLLPHPSLQSTSTAGHGLALDRIGRHLSTAVNAPIQMTLLPIARCPVPLLLSAFPHRSLLACPPTAKASNLPSKHGRQ